MMAILRCDCVAYIKLTGVNLASVKLLLLGVNVATEAVQGHFGHQQ